MKTFAKEFVKAMNDSQKKATSPYDTTGVVKRVEGDTAWVLLKSGERETPVEMSISCEKGDTVKVRVSGGRAWVTGNDQDPPTGDRKTKQVIGLVNGTNKKVSKIEERLESGEFETDVPEVDDVTAQYCLADRNYIPAGQTFDDIQYTSWSASLPTYEAGKYYWTRSVIHTESDEGEEETTYGEPRFYGEAQVIAETEALATSNDNHFWYDNTGAWVTQADKVKNSGYALQMGASGIAQYYNGKTMSAWTNSGVTFYDSSQESESGGVISRVPLASFYSSGISFNDSIPFMIGNSNSFIKWVQENGTWKIKICADSIEMGGSPVSTSACEWYTGTAMTYTDSYEHIYSGSGIASASVGDMYLNKNTSNTYRCTVGGAPSAAKWVYVNNIQGEQGEEGEQGPQGPRGYTGDPNQYMSFDSQNGLKVYSGDKSYSTYNTSYTQIKTDGMRVYKQGVCVSRFGDDIELGEGPGSTGYYTKISYGSNGTSVTLAKGNHPRTEYEILKVGVNNGAPYIKSDDSSLPIHMDYVRFDNSIGDVTASKITANNVVYDSSTNLIDGRTANQIIIGSKARNTYLRGIAPNDSSVTLTTIRAVANGMDSSKLYWGTSRRELKRDIESVKFCTPQDLYNMDVVQFKWKADKNGQLNIGFIAEDVNDIIPEMVSKDADGKPLMWDEFQMIALAVKTIQDQHKEIEELKREMRAVQRSLSVA